MRAFHGLVVALLVVSCTEARLAAPVDHVLGSTPKAQAAALVKNVTTAPAVKVTPEAVAQLRERLEGVAVHLQTLLDHSLAKTPLGSKLSTFLVDMRKSLKEEQGTKNMEVAMKQLQQIQNAVSALSRSLDEETLKLQVEERDQKVSILLGVLMTRQGLPMAEQLEVLQSADFRSLDVSQALLAKHDEKTPLFSQAANYLDAHHGVVVAKVTKKAGDLKATTELFAKHVDSMKKASEGRKQSHEAAMKELEARLQKASEKEKQTVKYAMKHEERSYKKWRALHDHDTATLESALVAMKKGDIKGLDRARAALEASMKAMQSKNSGFLVLLEAASRLTGQDCPYCVAQCVGQCHNEGKPYSACLTTCADAGSK